MPAKNKTNLVLATVFLLIRRCVRVLYVGINALARLVLPKNMGARLASNQNAAIFNVFWQSRTKSYFMYFKREFGKKGVNISALAGGRITLGWHNNNPDYRILTKNINEQNENKTMRLTTSILYEKS